jgi:hypothetical protein
MTEGRGEKARGTLDVTINDSDDVIGGVAEKGPAEKPKGKPGGRQVQTFVASSGRVSCPSRGLAGAMRA